jgi:Fic family protein
MAQFVHRDLRLLNPSFDSPLVDVLTDLEHLRRLQLQGTTPWPVFLQVKQVFHLLESLASARIEGNHTTLADYLEAKLDGGSLHGDPLREIYNIEQAMKQAEVTVQPGEPLSERLVCSLHATTVAGLERDGDRGPGAYRSSQVLIAEATHLPPVATHVPGYMAELVAFINRSDPPKYDLMKLALAHHRFAWVHPFGNGNGRVARLLTYVLLIKSGFQAGAAAAGHLLNPAAVFCADRDRYFTLLGEADAGTDLALENWCTYVLAGVRDELTNASRLADQAHLQSKVLLPAVAHARQRQIITAQEELVLVATIKAGVVKSSDLEAVLPGLNANQRTYQIRKLVESGMLQPIQAGARQYSIGFSHSILLRGVVQALSDEGFVSPALAASPECPGADCLLRS